MKATCRIDASDGLSISDAYEGDNDDTAVCQDVNSAFSWTQSTPICHSRRIQRTGSSMMAWQAASSFDRLQSAQRACCTRETFLGLFMRSWAKLAMTLLCNRMEMCCALPQAIFVIHQVASNCRRGVSVKSRKLVKLRTTDVFSTSRSSGGDRPTKQKRGLERIFSFQVYENLYQRQGYGEGMQ